MKNRGTFSGIVLIGVGTYFLVKQLQLPIFDKAFTWPTIMIVIGIAFFVQAYSTDKQSVFSGTILTGLGIHFHGRSMFSAWPDHWAMYPFIIGIAFLLLYQKTKKGLIPGLILVIIALLAYFYEGLIGWMTWIGWGVQWLEAHWPVTLIMIGFYLLFFKRR